MLSFHLLQRIGGPGMVMALLIVTASARGQVPGPDDKNRPPALDLPPQAIETAITLELYGHPDTAHRHIEVRTVDGHIDLSGVVTDKSALATAERLAARAAMDRSVVNRLELENAENSRERSPADQKRRFTELLATKFPSEFMRELTLTVYRVGDPAAWVVVVEGTVPSSRDQLALSESLLFGSPAAEAVINRTHLARGPVVAAFQPNVSFHGPLLGFDVDVRRGVDVDLGPFAFRTARRGRVGGSVTPDPLLLEQFLAAARSDADLRSAQLQSHVLGGVLTLEGKLTAANKLRAVALAQSINGIRGVVDRTEVAAGKPSYYRESDLADYLRYRLSEHAAAREVELRPAPQGQLKLQAKFPTKFHANLALAVMANDAALAELPIESEFTEDIPGPSKGIPQPE